MNDDELRTRLRVADPAAALPPLTQGERAAVLMLTHTTAEERPRRPRLRLLIGAVAVAAAVATAIVVLPRPGAGPTGPVLALAAPAADPSAICAPLADFAVQALRGSDVAFRGTVTAATAGSMEISPDRFFRGGPASTVRLRTDAGPALDGAVLHRGEQVLVAATDGRVATCGLSAADSPELRRYYDAAFG